VTVELRVVVAVLALVAVAAVVVVLARRHRVSGSKDPAPARPTGRAPRAAMVVNPTKFADLPALRQRVTAVCRSKGWADPLWLVTSADDPGRGQARLALTAGVDLVCSLGGDGTARQVAQTLVHSGTPLGLMPGGTGNLLARNLKLPLGSVEEALGAALGGQDRSVDVGLVSFDVVGDRRPSAEQVFLVMAGMGFDAAMMAGAPERLKARVGWLAYAVSGVQNLRGPRSRARIHADDRPGFSRRVHTVLVGNCGLLAGGIRLLPQAKVDDGWLDAVTLSPNGLASWVSVAARVLTRQGHDRVQHLRIRKIRVTVARPTEGQLDGDLVGAVRGLRARVAPGALLVRVPAGPGSS
jgi:diacylglycerol kinase (ATP)